MYGFPVVAVDVDDAEEDVLVPDLVPEAEVVVAELVTEDEGLLNSQYMY